MERIDTSRTTLRSLGHDEERLQEFNICSGADETEQLDTPIDLLDADFAGQCVFWAVERELVFPVVLRCLKRYLLLEDGFADLLIHSMSDLTYDFWFNNPEFMDTARKSIEAYRAQRTVYEWVRKDIDLTLTAMNVPSP